jgi:hypothetical protein
MSETLYVLGLMSAHYDVELEDIEGTSLAGVDRNVNIGVGVVIPAQKILDVIFSSELEGVLTSVRG